MTKPDLSDILEERQVILMQTEEHTNLFNSDVNYSINSIERTDELMNSDVLTGESEDSQIVQGCILNHAEIDETCTALTAYAKERYKQRGINIAVRELTISQLLSWGIVIEQDGKLLPTYAYHLLAGKAIPNVVSGIKCGVFKGSDRHFMVDNQLFDGPLIVQIENAYRYVLRMCRIGAEFSGVFRIDVPEFPMDTVRELLCNAVCHRSYLQPSNIQVALYDDRLEITSPGMLEPDLTIDDIKVGRSKIRNIGITRVMQYLGLFEGWGRGIPDMLADCERYGLPEPSIESIANDFRVNIYRKDPIA